jgi:hypothetical protein
MCFLLDRNVFFQPAPSFLLADCPQRDFQVRFWDNTHWEWEGNRALRWCSSIRERCVRCSLAPVNRRLEKPTSTMTSTSRATSKQFSSGQIICFSRNVASGRLLDLAKRRQKLPANNRAHKSREPSNFCGSIHSRDRDRNASAITTIFLPTLTRCGSISAWFTPVLPHNTGRRFELDPGAQAGLHLQKTAASPARPSPGYWLWLGRYFAPF